MAKDDEGIDYTAEGATPPHEKNDPTAKGYDEAADSGPGEYGVPEGQGACSARPAADRIPAACTSTSGR
jgi:hypothetical protein